MTTDDELEEVFRRMEVPDARWQRIYVLGAFVRRLHHFSQQARVTLLSQQTRALNLAYALHKRGIIQDGDRVCVIGGGVAGVTAAAALRHLGCQVTLLESKGTLLPLIQNTTRRWLHPHLYEWPDEGSDRPDAGLPLLNWRAAMANHVFRQIDEGFARCIAGGTIKVHLHAADIREPRPVDDEWEVAWNHGIDRFKALVLTVGFGVERPWEGVRHRSYWDNDDLDREDTRQDVHHTHHFISGCGDGGLTDFVRVRLRDFDHERTFQEFLQVAPADQLREQLRAAEGRAGGDPSRLAVEYHRLEVPSVDAWIERRRRASTSATLHGDGPHAYNTKASSLNRFLVSRILKVDAGVGSVYRPGELLRPITRSGNRFVVAMKDSGGQRLEAEFDEVTIRHGVQPALQRLSTAIFDACKNLPAAEEPDPTRKPMWLTRDPDIFGPIPPTAGWLPALGAPTTGAASSFAMSALSQARVPSFAPSATGAAVTTPAVGSATPPGKPTKASIRDVLEAAFPDESDLLSFLQDHFFEIWRKFGAGMTRTAKLNVVLTYPIEREILHALRTRHASKLAPLESLIEYE